MFSQIIHYKIYRKLEQFLSKIPIVSYVYSTIKKITDSISGNNKQAFKKVVYLEYPKKDLWSLGMVTGESKNSNGKKFYHVIILTTPNPTSGYLIFVDQSKVIDSSLTVEEGLKTIISGGILAREKNQII